ncbi:hypothetical protein JCM14244_04680 [Venenivibrio stagnispumantis]|uniref:Uncharacterized protein n=1 Tax=Venenivibrio stagnispumantis TaxID=407998 RepID=A0AA46AFN8_9AQUI|nr:hypothetical protein [Venenivibrio stagnispumantis]MCW4573792.1 hypothetical protein [Venenivibrio stagnispumantis]SMP20308.1 hypothetical protein SAMN06264868_12028 [Venenivibrio stagnispumantis]
MFNENKTETVSQRKRKAKDKKRLKELISKITPQNRHKEIDWGKPIGKEVW